MQQLPKLYLITDRRQIPAHRQLLDVLEELLRAGVRMLQLREKDLSAAELLPLAQQLRELTRSYDCLLLINDRIDVALAVAADGVHLGGHSLPVAQARKLIGPDKLIGVSTHCPAEIALAAAQSTDFVTFGPVFYTPSKAAFGEPVGLENLQRACGQSPLPVFGLGGIKQDNIPSVLNCGVHGIALISALLKAKSPRESCREMLRILDA